MKRGQRILTRLDLGAVLNCRPSVKKSVKLISTRFQFQKTLDRGLKKKEKEKKKKKEQKSV